MDQLSGWRAGGMALRFVPALFRFKTPLRASSVWIHSDVATSDGLAGRKRP